MTRLLIKKLSQRVFLIICIVSCFWSSPGYGLSKLREGIEAAKQMGIDPVIGQIIDEDAIYFFTKEMFMEEIRYLIKMIDGIDDIKIEIAQKEGMEILKIKFPKSMKGIAEDIFEKGDEGELRLGIKLEDIFYDLLRNEIQLGETNEFFILLKSKWENAQEKIDSIEIRIQKTDEHPLIIELKYYSPLLEEQTHDFDLYDPEDSSIFDVPSWKYKDMLEEITWDKLQFLEVSGEKINTGQIKIDLEYLEGIDIGELGKAGIVAVKLSTSFEDVSEDLKQQESYEQEVKEIEASEEKLINKMISLLKNEGKELPKITSTKEGTLGYELSHKIENYRVSEGKRRKRRKVNRLKYVLKDKLNNYYLIFTRGNIGRGGVRKSLYERILKNLVLSEKQEILGYNIEEGEMSYDIPGHLYEMSDFKLKGGVLMKVAFPDTGISTELKAILDQHKDGDQTFYRFVKLKYRILEELKLEFQSMLISYFRLGIYLASQELVEVAGFDHFEFLDLVRFLEYKLHIPMRKNFHGSLLYHFGLNRKYEGQFIRIIPGPEGNSYLGISGPDEKPGLEEISIINK